tara:strand:- start:3511 stop:5589 length:2079 start_codon:yes stop_codon:yes gene_type:complete
MDIIVKGAPDFMFGLAPGDLEYDIETFPNCFTFIANHPELDKRWVFEISDFKNELPLLMAFIDVLRRQLSRLVGYNNLGFDYPVIHDIYKHGEFATAQRIYTKAMSIINGPYNQRFAHMIWDNDRVVPQIDLYKIHHFDNVSKATSLKVLEFNMGMSSIEDLPFDVGTHLDQNQIATLIDYNHHDVKATAMFHERTLPMIAMRERLSEKFNTNMINMSDVKIGETMLIKGMESSGIQCYYKDEDNKRQKKQTKRESLDLSTVIFPYVSFELPEFSRILQWLKAQTITETKGVFTDLTADVQGLTYKIGTGGLHASMRNAIIESSDTHQLMDIDVKSFYPNVAIKNNLYPAHLGEQFCDAYLDVYHTRQSYPKSAPENGAYKLALNGAYGGSNNEYSPFLDMAYTMSITINGQMLLLMLVEQMIKIPGLTMVQCNTDGVTYLCPREHVEHSRSVCKWWEELTKLELEEVLYSRMWIRDVNSYIAEKQDGGKLKRIGAYAYETAEENPVTRELPYHKDWSMRVVAKAAEAFLVRGADLREFIENHNDINDFFMRAKVPRSAMLEWGGKRVANIVRYYVSTDGHIMEKVMQAAGPIGEFKRKNKITDAMFHTVMDEIGLGEWDNRIHTGNKSIYEERRTEYHAPFTVMVCNYIPSRLMNPECAEDHDDQREYFDDISYDFYVKEAEKLVLKMRGI